MKNTRTRRFHERWRKLGQGVSPWVEEYFGKLDDKLRLFMAVCETVIDVAAFRCAQWRGNGRPPANRLNIFKAVLNIPDTKELVRMLRAESLLRRLCGRSGPRHVSSEAIFSRAFDEFTKMGSTEQWFADLVTPFLADAAIETVSYDSAPVEARAKAANVKREPERVDPDQPQSPYTPDT